MTYIEGVRRMAKGAAETDLFGEPVYEGFTAGEAEQIKSVTNRRHLTPKPEPAIRPFRVVREAETLTWLLHD